MLVVLAPWTHQIEDTPPGGRSGRKFTSEERASLVAELRAVFLDELDAKRFDPVDSSESVYGAIWD